MTALALPIDPRLPEIVEAVRRQRALVLVAEPGAGKTTRVPRALLDAGLADGEIVVLEPRRLATRLAAQRVADELGEPLGRRIGYQIRFEDRTSSATRVRFVTEGILTRRLASDPLLADVAVVVLDEFHERSLHADLALALLRRLRQTRRPDLAVVVMSATLDAAAVAEFLPAPVIDVEGRRFATTIEYADRPDQRPLEARVASAVAGLYDGGLDGDALVFLPGAAEIRRALTACEPIAAHHALELAMLHGDLPAAEQDRAVRRGARRKVILSTNVAETSLTLEGVRAVVDSGLRRVARHSPWSGLSRLETATISQSQATQRAGRAGRLAAGRCIRLYSRFEHDAWPKFDQPEIMRADLTETVLALAGAGVADAAHFAWFTAPPAAALDAATALLARLGALDAAGAITPLGRQMEALPVHPRLARLVLAAAERGVADDGALLAALIGERDVLLDRRVGAGARGAATASGPSDLLFRLDALEAVAQHGTRSRSRGPRAEARAPQPEALRRAGLDPGPALAALRARDQLLRALPRPLPALASPETRDAALLQSVLAAFPDRVAKRRAPRSREFVLAAGRAVRQADDSVVDRAPFVVVVEAAESPGRDPLARLISAIEPDWLVDLFPHRVSERTRCEWSAEHERVEVVSALLFDELPIDQVRRSDVRSAEVSRALAEAALARGVAAFCDPEALEALRARLEFAAPFVAGLPLLDDTTVREALIALCDGRVSFAHLREADLVPALLERLTPAQRAALERAAPLAVQLPGRRRAPVHYERGKPPYVASRLQDFFGWRDAPRLADGRVPLTLHLLAPNQRAVQVTSDLAGFWARHYPALRKELMRRYPRHKWPEDPTS